MYRWVAILLIGTLFAGCSSPAETVEDPFAEVVDPAKPPLFGYMFDQTLRPLPGATVELLQTGEIATAANDGGYGFTEFPRDEVLILVARMDGYIAATKQTSVVKDATIQLDFVLKPEPKVVPYVDVIPYDGFLSCELGYAVGETGSTFACDATGNDRIIDFNMNDNVVDVIVEITWDAVTPLSRSLRATIETLDAGDLSAELGTSVGASTLKLQIGSASVEKYFDAGGRARLEIDAYPITDEEEAAAGAAVSIRQDFQVFISVFYHALPDPTYTFVDA